MQCTLNNRKIARNVLLVIVKLHAMSVNNSKISRNLLLIILKIAGNVRLIIVVKLHAMYV